MNYYRVLYLHNEVSSVSVTVQKFHFTDSNYHYAIEDKLMYAVVQAENEEDAWMIGAKIASDFQASGNSGLTH